MKLATLLLFALAFAVPLSAQVVINELRVGPPGWCEITNLGGVAADVSGWSLIMNDDPFTSTVATLPADTILDPGESLVVAEAATAAALGTGAPVFVVGDIGWGVGEAGACGLNDASGAGVDLVVFLQPFFLPNQNPPSPFTGTLFLGEVMARGAAGDTNSASDWSVLTPAQATPGALNPGQMVAPSQPPTAALAPLQAAAVVGVPVRFRDASLGQPASWQWDLDGDGLTDRTERHPSFVYSTPGRYDVTLMVANAQGVDSVTVTAAINVLPRPSAPYFESFDAGPPGPEWSFRSENAAGRIRRLPSFPPSPGSGSQALVMDAPGNGLLVTNEAVLSLDLEPSDGARLRYCFRESGDENHLEDGVWISDGVTTAQVTSHLEASASWTTFEVDLNLEAARFGLNLGNRFEIIFRQRDDSFLPLDGVLFDDIELLGPLPEDSGQANAPSGALRIPDALNLNGQPPVDGIAGPFFADGQMLSFEVSGEPAQAYALAVGPLNRNNVLVPGAGSLDLGLLGAQLDVSDIGLVLDGFRQPTLLDSLAVLDAAGLSQLSFDFTGLAPGVIGGFQAVVADSQGGLRLTAAIEFTITP